MNRQRVSVTGFFLVGLMGLVALIAGQDCNFDRSNIPDANQSPVSNPGSTPSAGTPDGMGDNNLPPDNGGGGGGGSADIKVWICFKHCFNGNGPPVDVACNDSVGAATEEAAVQYAQGLFAADFCPNGTTSSNVTCYNDGTKCNQ